jgi:hypothetical protein
VRAYIYRGKCLYMYEYLYLYLYGVSKNTITLFSLVLYKSKTAYNMAHDAHISG